jgi:hypothetical protein
LGFDRGFEGDWEDSWRQWPSEAVVVTRVSRSGVSQKVRERLWQRTAGGLEKSAKLAQGLQASSSAKPS